MSDYLWNLVNKGLSVLAGLITSVLLARYLGVVLRGELSFLIQTAGLIAIALGLGFNQTFPFYFKRQPTHATFASFVRVFLGQFVAFGLVGLAIVVVFRTSSTGYLVALAMSAMLYQQMESTLAAVDVRLKIRVNIALSVLRILLNGAMVLWLPESLAWPVAIQVLTWLAAAVAYLILTGVGFGKRNEPGFVRELVTYSWMPMLTSAMVILNYNVDTLMLKALGTPEDLGLYAVAAGLIIYFWVIPDAIKEVLVSRVVRNNDPRAVALPLKAAMVAAAVTIVGFALLGKPFVTLLFGREFAPSYLLAVILSIGVVSMTAYKVIGVTLLADGRRGFYFGSLLTSVVLNIVFNLWAIPAHGAIGAAWVSVATYSITGALFVGYYVRLHSLGFGELLIPTKHDVARIRTALRRSR